jgi:hypothetical protein
MVEPFYILRTNVRSFQSHIPLKAWTANASNEARAQGAKYGRVSTHPSTGEVVFEAWKEEHPETGEPRWQETVNG